MVELETRDSQDQTQLNRNESSHTDKDPFAIKEIELEEIAIDGICGVY